MKPVERKRSWQRHSHNTPTPCAKRIRRAIVHGVQICIGPRRADVPTRTHINSWRGNARSLGAWPRGGSAVCSGTSSGSPSSVAQALQYSPRRGGSLECSAPRKSERTEAARTQGQPISGNVGKFVVAGWAHCDSASARSSLAAETPRAPPWRRPSRKTQPLNSKNELLVM